MHGNMAQVFHTLHDNHAREQFIQAADERTGPLAAEIVEGTSPLWHVLIVGAGEERIAGAHLIGRMHRFTAADHLVDRGFGIYVPEYNKLMPAAGARSEHKEKRRLFPGYVFLFVWDVETHLRRIRACPGVIHLLYNGEQPAIVPDALIDKIQGIEFRENILGTKRRRRRTKWDRMAESGGNGTVTISTYSALDGIERLDDAGRISALHKALGLGG